MMIYISTNLYTPSELENIFALLYTINDKDIGIELFPEWHDQKFIDSIKKT